MDNNERDSVAGDYSDTLLDHLQAELLSQRERYNTLYAMVKRAKPRLDPDRFKHNLFTFAAPLINAVAADERSQTVSVLYQLTLELTGVELFARSEAVRAVWTELMPSASELIEENPELAVAALTNAAYNLEQEPGADWSFWFQQMILIAPRCKDLGQWLQLAQVVSWVSGMAHYQSSALELADSLPDELIEKVVPRWDKVKTDPWWARRPGPGRMIRVHKVGGFVGFGGVFRRPPEVMAAGEDRFLVSDGTDDWLLFCDGFGATLKKAVDFALCDPQPSQMRVNDSGEVLWDGQRATVPEIAPVGSYDATGHLVAVAGKFSHHVHVLLGTPRA